MHLSRRIPLCTEGFLKTFSHIRCAQISANELDKIQVQRAFKSI